MSAVISEKTVRGIREVMLLAYLSIASFFLISLLSFNIEDAGWSHGGSIQDIQNASGMLGAWVADFLLSMVGLMAYMLPLSLICLGYLKYKQLTSSRFTLFLRVLGFIFSLVAGSALLNLHLVRSGIELPRSTGGILGQETGDWLLIFLGNSGATLILLAAFLAGITLLTGLSWINLIDKTGKMTLLAVQYVSSLFYQFYDRQRDKSFEKKQKSAREKLLEENPQQEEYSQVKTVKTSAKKRKKIKIEPTIEATGIETNSDDQPEEIDSIEDFDASNYQGTLPPIELLDKRMVTSKGYSQSDLEEMSRQVENVLQDFNIVVEVVAVNPGPVITRFEMQLAAGVKVSRVSSLSKDIARGLSVTSVRVVEVIQGKSVIGLEIPNQERELVSLRDLIVSRKFEKAKSNLTLAMGKDISGTPLMADLAKMPHALVAGTTGSGKSVAINTMILSLLYKASAEDIRMIMIDPKMLELSVYEGIPHLLTPVVTDMKDAQNALRWAVAEMERRYKLMSKLGVRNLSGYNQAIANAEAKGQPIRDPLFVAEEPLAEGEAFPTLKKLPQIVIIIDELADMMMIVGKKVEELIARLAQKARASGIHLVLATQRPSVDVLTGLIKANVPTRISFQVSSRIDSRTILDQAGAEALLGNGDMLFLPSGTSIPVRAHGAFVDDHEVHKVVDFLKQVAPANYLDEITQERSDTGESVVEGGGSESDALYDEAVAFVTDSRKASISSVQRRFKVGYNRAARMIEEMEMAGVVSAPENNGSRQVLAPPPRD